MRQFFDESPDRALGIALPAILDNRITEILRTAMRQERKVADDLLKPDGALGNFAVKIDVAFMFGLISKETRRDLRLIVRIRNSFAHRVEIRTFDDPPISSRIREMHIYEVLIALRDSKPFDPQKVEPFREKVKSQILRHEMETMRDSFRMCVRMLIHHLNMLHDAMLQTP